jgi:signal transduction histidine kinase
MTDAMSIAFLLKSLGYGIPAAILVMSFMVLKILIKYQTAKTDKDRREHMLKWESMIETQHAAIKAQENATTSLIRTHQEELQRLIEQNDNANTRIIETHRSETDRMFTLYERQGASLEAMAHNLSVISNRIEQKTICPNTGREHL